jgi:hypothetical protein
MSTRKPTPKELSDASDTLLRFADSYEFGWQEETKIRYVAHVVGAAAVAENAEERASWDRLNDG